VAASVHRLMTTRKEPGRTLARAHFHHGQLREALIHNALQAIAQRGVEGFSLREAAQQAGVSPSAAYRHFEDKAALLAEIARQAFAALADAMEHAMAQAVGGRRTAAARAKAAFVAQGLAYMRFALAEPTRYRVMFGPYGAGSGRDVGGRSAAGATPYELLMRATGDVLGPGATASEQHSAAVFAWATVHGLADLLISRSLSHPGDAATEALMTQTVGRVHASVVARNRA